MRLEFINLIVEMSRQLVVSVGITSFMSTPRRYNDSLICFDWRFTLVGQQQRTAPFYNMKSAPMTM